MRSAKGSDGVHVDPEKQPAQDGTVDPVDAALGAEIRRARLDQGLTRKQLVADLPMHIQTLANYENGIRRLGLSTLVVVCNRLGVLVTDLVGLALQRAEITPYQQELRVDLASLAEDENPAMTPIREWAQHRLEHDPHGPAVATLVPAVVAELAHVVGFEYLELVRYLVRYTPSVARPAGAAERDAKKRDAPRHAHPDRSLSLNLHRSNPT